MKTYLILLLLPFIVETTFAQTASLLPEMTENSADYRFFTMDENRVIYRFHGVYSAFFENKFIVFDAKTGGTKDVEVESATYKGETGFAMSYFIKNDKIYEIVLFKASKTNSSAYNGIVVRDLKTFKQQGEVVIFDEIQTIYTGAGQGLQIMECEDGFNVIAGSMYAKKHYIKHFNSDLKEEWMVPLVELDAPGTELKNTLVTDNDEVLLTIIESSAAKTSWRDKSIKFVVISSDGESNVFSAQIEEDLTVQAYDFNYNAIKKEIVGVFSITKTIDAKKNITSGIGYAIMVWNLEGGLMNSKSNYLTFKDFDNNELHKFNELSKAKKSIIENGKDLPSVAMNFNSSTFFLKNGDVIIACENFKVVENGYVQEGGALDNANLIYCMNADGDLKWTNFFPADIQIDFIVQSYVQDQDKLFMYSKFDTDKFGELYPEFSSLATAFETGKSQLLMERVLDVATGDVLTFKPLISEPLENFSLVTFNKRDDLLLFEYHYPKKNKMRGAFIKL